MSYHLQQVPAHDWLGKVPSEWDRRKLKFLFRVSKEKNGNDPVGEMLSVSGYRGIEVKQYDDDAKKRTDDELIDYRVVRPNQLVVNTMWLNYAGLGVSEFTGHVSPAYRSYYIDKCLYPRFVHYLMRSDIYVRGYTKYMQGIRPNSLQIATDDFDSFPILVPPFETQFAIAGFLDREAAKIDTLIENQEQLIKLLEEKRQAVISHAVTKGMNPDVRMKDSGVQWLGEVPEHWDVTFAKRFVEVIDCKHVTAEFVGDGLPLASIGEVKGWQVDLANAKLTTPEFYALLTEGGRKPVNGDIIYSRNASVGEAALVTANHPKFAMGQDVCLLRSGDAIDAEFVLFQLASNSVKYQLEMEMVGATFKRINVEAVRNFVICIPPFTEQMAIVEFLKMSMIYYDRIAQETQTALVLLRERRTALISAAVTGKIDVRNAV